MPRHIVAIGGIESAAQRRALDRAILDLTGTDQPAVAFIPTATGDAPLAIVNFYASFGALPCRASHLPLFARTPDLRAYLAAQDVIWVGGGNTKSMLAVWRDWGLPELLREAYERGVVLAGVSAGAICWFEQGVTDSWEGELRALDCLGFLPGSCCPHYSGEPDRRPSYHGLLQTGAIGAGVAIDDGAALHFVDGAPSRVLRARAGASVHEVRLVEGAVREVPLDLPAVDVGAGS
jgi:dipeptidase E